jgi:hypothetical protein
MIAVALSWEDYSLLPESIAAPGKDTMATG